MNLGGINRFTRVKPVFPYGRFFFSRKFGHLFDKHGRSGLARVKFMPRFKHDFRKLFNFSKTYYNSNRDGHRNLYWNPLASIMYLLNSPYSLLQIFLYQYHTSRIDHDNLSTLNIINTGKYTFNFQISLKKYFSLVCEIILC